MSSTKEAEQKNTVKQLDTLEEDDEFEEFITEDWKEQDEDPEDIHQWEDNWDDDDVEDDFSVQLRQELEKSSAPGMKLG